LASLTPLVVGVTKSVTISHLMSNTDKGMVVRYGSEALPMAAEMAKLYKGPHILIPDNGLPPRNADFRYVSTDSAEWLALTRSQSIASCLPG
jgi:hypothetical protein